MKAFDENKLMTYVPKGHTARSFQYFIYNFVHILNGLILLNFALVEKLKWKSPNLLVHCPRVHLLSQIFSSPAFCIFDQSKYTTGG